MPRRSVCTSELPVAFYWQGAPRGCSIEAAVEALMQAFEAEDRWLNPYMRADLRSAFRERLKRAERGRLRTYQHVDNIARDPSVDLYEIRWGDLLVGRVDPVSRVNLPPIKAEARLYHVEFDGHYWVVGLHAHDKRFGAGADADREAQDREIDKALTRARGGLATTWDIPELQDRHLDLTLPIR